MVHRCNKDIATNCSSLVAGQTREIQRNNTAARVAEDRAEARKARKRKEDRDDKEGKMRAELCKASVIQTRTEIIVTQLQTYRDYKSSFITEMGQEAYDKKILELLKKMPDPNEEKDQADVESEDDEDEE